MKYGKFLTLAMLTLFVGSTFTMPPVMAAATRIYLEPSNHIYTVDTAYIGMKFNVTVWVENVVADIGGAQINLEFNDDIINVTRWWAPNWDAAFFMADPYSALPTPPNPGYVHLGAEKGKVQVSVLKGGLPPTAPWGHDGKICILEFNITAAPSDPGKFISTLRIDTTDTYLLDSMAGEVPGVTKQNGYYEISKPGPEYLLTITTSLGGTTNPTPGIYTYEQGTTANVTALPSANYVLDHWELNGSNIGSDNPLALTMNSNHTLHAIFAYSPPEGSRIFVDPFEIVDPEAIPCQTNFHINISIGDIADMKECVFNLTYDTNIISIIGLNFQAVDGQYPTIDLIANDTAGFAWMKLNYANPVTASDLTPLVTLTFHVDSLGATPLNLTNTEITDPYDNPIPHDVYHGFYMGLIRDVAVTNILLSRNWAYPGWPVNITVTVKNKGNVNETFNTYTYYDSYVIGTITVDNLAPNEERNITFVWDTTGVGEGNYTIKAEAQTVPYELDTTNNVLIDGEVWIMTYVHDIAVVEVVSESWVYHGWTAHINVTVQNLGDFTESFSIKAYYNTTLIGAINVTNLSPSSHCTAEFTLDTHALLPCHTYNISGEATLVPYEYNETNNFLVGSSLKVRFIGDVNGDDKVDLKDVYLVSLAFGSEPGHPRWDPEADINRDIRVDLKDVYIVRLNYGKGCFP